MVAEPFAQWVIEERFCNDVPDFARVGAAIAAIGLPTLAVQEGGYAVDVIGSSLDAFLQGVGA